jgi:hypothetical protein
MYWLKYRLGWESVECTQNFRRKAYWKATTSKREKDSEITMKLNTVGKDCEDLEGVVQSLVRWWPGGLCIRRC